MTPKKGSTDFEKWLERANGSDALLAALQIALCHPESNRLVPEQKADLLTSAADALKTLYWLELSELLMKEIDGKGKPNAEQITARVGYTAIRTARDTPRLLEIFFNRCEMLKP